MMKRGKGRFAFRVAEETQPATENKKQEQEIQQQTEILTLANEDKEQPHIEEMQQTEVSTQPRPPKRGAGQLKQQQEKKQKTVSK
jgi:hypothetical protein